LSSEPWALSHALRASDPFKRFKPEPTHEVRQADVTGAELDRLRARRKMLREMDPERALQVIEFHRLNLFQALALAQREGKLIVPNFVHDRILIVTDEKSFPPNYAVWTGTLVIYEAPNMPFRDKVTSRYKENNEYSFSFSVPKQLQGKKNCALAIEHPDFEVIAVGNNRYEVKLVDGANVHLIENFPYDTGDYGFDPKTGVPTGKKVTDSNKKRELWRDYNAYISLLVRYCNETDGYHRRIVDMHFEPPYDLWVALF